MNNNDIARFSKKVVQYFWDPLPNNEDPSRIWCLGQSYESRYAEIRESKPSVGPSTDLTDSEDLQAESAVVTQAEQKPEQSAENGQDGLSGKSPADLSRQEEEALGWPSEFLDDLESRIWLTYRNGFPSIPKSADPAAASAMSFTTKLRSLTNQGGFTSDTGWGCMIRSGQSLLANAMAELRLGRDWRKGEKAREHQELLSLFADSPGAPFSIHRFVEHGAEACDKHPGEWFGPSATARCIQ